MAFLVGTVLHAEQDQRDRAAARAAEAIALLRRHGKPQAEWFARLLDKYRASGDAADKSMSHAMAFDWAAPPATPIALSPSVERMTRSSHEVTALELARRLWEDHPNYPGRDRAIQLLVDAERTPSLPLRSPKDWIDAVIRLLDAPA